MISSNDKPHRSPFPLIPRTNDRLPRGAGSDVLGDTFRIEPPLMPVRVDRRRRADVVQSPHLLFAHLPTGRRQVVPKLLFGARADDNRRHPRLAQDPVQRRLGDSGVVLSGYLVENLDYVVAPLLVDCPRVSALRPPATIWCRTPAPELAGEEAGR